MVIKAGYIQEFQALAQALQDLSGEEPYAAIILLEVIHRARVALLHYEHYVDTESEVDVLLQFCKEKLQTAKLEVKTGQVVHALWITRTVITSLLSNEIVTLSLGIT